ncbi:MetQ/NlpA family ABC transporter substrate-binding protein [Microbacterium sediminis]|uniref:Lipoprotein n=1 Tax=Microbacterium sediminis TaxID=904291 RepID=A0A1B9NFZ8_9MICO|nr:MetQ/NlpA family ABC transporter substrate-binding protein [Microbacterium sediminis]OCG75529.1 ABC transporter substrate-binding protein [Microbacterium sediminis]QBR73924.1 ABC transporter substrate-binding protein [Microbacterium sediminis]
MSRFTRTTAALAGAAALALGLTACGASAGDTSSEGEGLGTISVGATAVPAGELLQFVADELAPAEGLTIEIQEYSDYNTPNPALAQGANDANLFQHGPFLDLYLQDSGEDLVEVGPVYLPPLALYSETYESLEDLPDGATIALPNDASNEGRALLLLASAGLIETTDAPTTVSDITANPHDFEFSEIDAATLPAALQQMDAAIVNFNFASAAGISSDLQLLSEGQDSEYFNILATRAELADDPRIEKLYELLTSDETKAWIEETYDGLVIPAE